MHVWKSNCNPEQARHECTAAEPPRLLKILHPWPCQKPISSESLVFWRIIKPKSKIALLATVLEVYFKKQAKLQHTLEQKNTSHFIPRGILLHWRTHFTPFLQLWAKVNLKISSSATCHRRWLRLLLQVKESTADKSNPCPAEGGTDTLCTVQSRVR